MSGPLLSKLNDFYKSSHEIDNLVIIPSGYVVGKEPVGYFNESFLFNALKTTPISIILPYDNNIHHGNFSYISWGNEISHSPKERAEMIYEAISARNEDGSYKYHNIYFTGGSNTEDVIFDLDKICRERGALPRRKDTLKTYGFSDASQLHHYLGQRGISTPVYYSKYVGCLIKDLSKQTAVSTDFHIEPVNETAKEIQELSGYLQPGNQSQVENKLMYQTRFFSDDYNFLVVEFRNRNAVDAFLKTCKQFKDKKIILLLSRDTDQEAKDYLIKHSQYPIFTGMPVGHRSCLREGRGICLFSLARIQKTGRGYHLISEDKASDNVLTLRNEEVRLPPFILGGKEHIAILKDIDGNAGGVFENLEKLKVGSPSLLIRIPYKVEDLVQTMEISVKTLLETKIIDPEKLEYLSFEAKLFDKNQKDVLKKRLEDLVRRYLPKINEVKVNESVFFKNKNRVIDVLKSASLETESVSKDRKIDYPVQKIKSIVQEKRRYEM